VRPSILSRIIHPLLNPYSTEYPQSCANPHYFVESLGAQAYNPCIMNRLTLDKRVRIVNALVEGNSLRATSRLAGVAFNTVLKLLPEIGKACEEYQRRALVNLPCKRVQ
jgi:hypothetical protein